MDVLKKLSREAQVVLGAAVLYLIFSFLDWQQVSAFGISVGRSEWAGVGVIAGLLVIALLLWEAVRFLELNVQLGSLTPGLVSVAIASLLLLFTVITFLTHGTARHWPAWIGLLLSVVIAAAAFARARAEGVQMPDVSSMASRMTDRPPSSPPPAPSESDALATPQPVSEPPFAPVGGGPEPGA
jgi:hypothetical protein